jgi:hypothetical protein
METADLSIMQALCSAPAITAMRSVVMLPSKTPLSLTHSISRGGLSAALHMLFTYLFGSPYRRPPPLNRHHNTTLLLYCGPLCARRSDPLRLLGLGNKFFRRRVKGLAQFFRGVLDSFGPVGALERGLTFSMAPGFDLSALSSLSPRSQRLFSTDRSSDRVIARVNLLLAFWSSADSVRVLDRFIVVILDRLE